MFQNIKINFQNKILLISFLIFVILYLIISMKNKSSSTESEKKPLYADTLIPKGYVLIPIELANKDAVAGLINQYAIVDLYTGTEGSSILLARRVKLIQAPLNPNQYAVMVPENFSHNIMKYKESLWAIVQNRLDQNDDTKQPSLTTSTPTLINLDADNRTSIEKTNIKTKPQSTRVQRDIEIEYYQKTNSEKVL